MTGRDRMVLLVLAVVAVLVLSWIKVVSPERKRASSVQEKVSTAEVALSQARSELSEAHHDQSRYSSAYASLVSLGEAVPADEEVSSLVYALDQASGKAHVEFRSIQASSGSSEASVTPTTEGASSGFRQLPFTFTFVGSFFDLYHLMQKLQGFTSTTSGDGVKVSGRLLTIDSVQLAPEGSLSESTENLTGTITATAYVLPPGESLTAGATAAAPAGLSTGTTESSSESSTPAPAVVKVAP
ncbi:MAG TPA: hypothetical protein VGF95_14700 [Solirubrobacteraceae bacterium]|jgi:Tfp pilus assembly protein PilO